MSYTVANQPAKQRPGTVTVASVLLYVAVAIQVVSIAVGALTIGRLSDAFSGELPGTQQEQDTVRTAMKVGVGIGLGFSVLFAIGWLVLAILVGKGKNPARIVTWVLAGIGVCCYGASLAGTAFQSSMSSLGGASNANSQQIQQRIQDALPSWQTAYSTVSTIVELLIYVVVIILLALPASNDFFRKEQEVWVPPTYPGNPGLPGGTGPGPTGYPTPPQP